jgi:hypothetical protein
MLEIYDPPGAKAGARREILTMQQVASRKDLAVAAKLPAGAIGVINGGIIAWGHWVETDLAVPVTLLSNGDETAILVFAPGGAAWPAGQYKLHAKLDRDRWANIGAPDPEQHYHDEATLALTW